VADACVAMGGGGGDRWCVLGAVNAKFCVADACWECGGGGNRWCVLGLIVKKLSVADYAFLKFSNGDGVGRTTAIDIGVMVAVG
jgi:hypothetical protein